MGDAGLDQMPEAVRLVAPFQVAVAGCLPRAAEAGVEVAVGFLEANSVQALTEIVQRTGLATVLPDAITHDHPHLTLVRGYTPAP